MSRLKTLREYVDKELNLLEEEQKRYENLCKELDL